MKEIRLDSAEENGTERGVVTTEDNIQSLADIVSKIEAPPEYDYRLMMFRAFETAISKGFHKDPVLEWLEGSLAPVEVLEAYKRTELIARIGLIHTEVTELMQLVKRHGIHKLDQNWTSEFGAEGADIQIRLWDLFGRMGFDFHNHVLSKMDFNDNRPYLYNTPYEQKED